MRADTRFVGLRTLLAAVLILALAAGTAVVAPPSLPPVGTRSVLRTATVQPFEPRNYASPLSGFRTYWQQPKTDDVLLTVRGLPAGARIRIATLDSYDGVVYSVGSAAVDPASGSFSRVPFEFDQAGVSGTTAQRDDHRRGLLRGLAADGRQVQEGQLQRVAMPPRSATTSSTTTPRARRSTSAS